MSGYMRTGQWISLEAAHQATWDSEQGDELDLNQPASGELQEGWRPVGWGQICVIFPSGHGPAPGGFFLWPRGACHVSELLSEPSTHAKSINNPAAKPHCSFLTLSMLTSPGLPAWEFTQLLPSQWLWLCSSPWPWPSSESSRGLQLQKQVHEQLLWLTWTSWSFSFLL